MSAFTVLPLTKPMIENLETLGYQEMTPVQAESLPHVLKGEDLLAQADGTTVEVAGQPVVLATSRERLGVPGEVLYRVPSLSVPETDATVDEAIQHDAINLGQGFPDFDGPASVMDAAMAAMRDGHNQYAPMPGVPALRQAVEMKPDAAAAWFNLGDALR